MAKMKCFALTPHQAVGNSMSTLLPNMTTVKGVPVIYKQDGRMWEEASIYLAERSVELGEFGEGGDIQTVQSIAWHLKAYLDFCEERKFDPMVFGYYRTEKPTYLFKARLLQQRAAMATSDDSKPIKRLSPSTVSTRMNAVAKFFVWTMENNLVAPENPPCKVKHISIQINGRNGTTRNFKVKTTDLAIRHSSIERNTVEGGLTPVSLAVRDLAIQGARDHCSQEFAMMLELGFRTGARIQTICDLKCSTLDSARQCEDKNMWSIAVGPGTDVATKQNVNYDLMVPDDLLSRLREYSRSSRRLLRVAKAADLGNKNLLFINRFGNRYNRRGMDNSYSISQDMARLRRAMKEKVDLKKFYFHCSRATFGTSIILAGLKAGIKVDRILNRLKTLMGHKDSKTSLKYVQFVETEIENGKIDAELNLDVAKA